jgi:DNA-binding LacI/PurR family transcriptional regulator
VDRKDEQRPARRRVTTTDVARESGVSRATVSYVLNDVPGTAISQRTRDLVKSTALRLGHVPNASARALRSGRSSIVLALLPSFSRGFVADAVLEALDRALSERGYALAVHHYDPKHQSLSDLWGMISPAIVVALAGLTLNEESVIRRADARLVAVHNTLDHVEAGRMQARHLIAAGHTRLGYLRPDDEALATVADARWSGVKETCAALGISEPVLCKVDMLVPELRGPIEAWRAAGITAVCAHNDLLAAMILLELGRMGLHAPDDIAVIGNDDHPIAKLGITTVAIEIGLYAEFVVDSVMSSLRGEEPALPSSTFLKLVVRDTA